ADNVLWGGEVLENETTDPQARGIIDFNEMILKETSIEHIIIPLRDGLMLIRKRGK
ncbi:MAG: methyltransferase, partial [Bacteroidetes bacterium]